jgi:tRNA threonylcarbamoyladenosine biosynthesis protein TsaE
MNDNLQLVLASAVELKAAGNAILSFAGNARIFLVNGPMGSGKTTLIKALCEELGSEDNFSSPTFSIVNEYQSPAGKIYHFDLYRIKTSEELLDLGAEEYFSSGNYCFIEWPELAEELLDKEGQIVNILIRQEGLTRYIAVSHNGSNV